MSSIIPVLSNLDDLAEAINDPNPNRPIENAIGEFGQDVCDRLARGQDVINALPGTIGLFTGVCRPYWNRTGTDEPEAFPEPVVGGQCPGVLYEVTENFTATNTGAPSTRIIGNFRGPIRRVAPVAPKIQCSGASVNSYFNFIDGTGNSFFSGNSCAAFDRAPSLVCVPLEPEPPGGCGNAPTFLQPGINLPPDPGPLPPGTGINVDIRGNPVLVLPPTIEISPNVNIELTPELAGQFGGGGGQTPQAPVAAPDKIGEGSGAGGGENDFGEPPAGERWVGCCVQISDRPVGSGVIPQSVPQDVYPTTIGNVHLRFQNSSGDESFDTPVTDRSRNVCVWEPLRGLNPTGVFVNLLPGYSYVVTPYSVPLEQ